MQADDYHLDRPLFYACQEAVSKFCPETKSGDGRIYKCLLENKNNLMMPKKVWILFYHICLNIQNTDVCMGGTAWLMKCRHFIILIGFTANVFKTCKFFLMISNKRGEVNLSFVSVCLCIVIHFSLELQTIFQERFFFMLFYKTGNEKLINYAFCSTNLL